MQENINLYKYWRTSNLFLSVGPKTADIRTNTDHIGCFYRQFYSIDRKALICSPLFLFSIY